MYIYIYVYILYYKSIIKHRFLGTQSVFLLPRHRCSGTGASRFKAARPLVTWPCDTAEIPGDSRRNMGIIGKKHGKTHGKYGKIIRFSMGIFMIWKNHREYDGDI